MQNKEQQMTPFKKAIQDFLRKTAINDSEFKKHLVNPEKNIDDCLTYILNTVRKSGRQGFSDDEIFGFALHYYEEENVKIGNKVQAKVIVNTEIQLTAEEIEKERQQAKERIYQEERNKLYKSNKANRVVANPKTEAEPKIIQGTFF